MAVNMLHVRSFLKTANVLKSVERHVQVASINNVRFKNKPTSKRNGDIGISERSEVFVEDPNFLQYLEDEDDFTKLETKSWNLPGEMDKLKRVQVKKEIKMKQAMTIRKFFRPPKQPRMLTWNEQEQIRFLHQQDPVAWNLERLADSFPASKEIMKLILKKSWRPDSVEAMKIRDLQVVENWKLLEEGKLDAPPDLLEHFKKFTNRSETLLAQMDSADYYEKLLPVKKEEPNWNKGKMKNILISYEKSLAQLEKQHLQLEQSKMKEITDGNPVPMRKSEEEAMKDRIELDIMMKTKNEETDSFVVGGRDWEYSQPVTFSQLEDNLKKKYSKGKSLDLTEKVIFNQSFDQVSPTYINKNERIKLEEKDNTHQTFSKDTSSSNRKNKNKHSEKVGPHKYDDTPNYNYKNDLQENVTQESVTSMHSKKNKNKLAEKVAPYKYDDTPNYNYKNENVTPEQSFTSIDSRKNTNKPSKKVAPYKYDDTPNYNYKNEGNNLQENFTSEESVTSVHSKNKPSKKVTPYKYYDEDTPNFKNKSANNELSEEGSLDQYLNEELPSSQKPVEDVRSEQQPGINYKLMNMAGYEGSLEPKHEVYKPALHLTRAMRMQFQRENVKDPILEMKELVKPMRKAPVPEVKEVNEYAYESVKDKEVCEQEEDSLQGTCFWNSSPTAVASPKIPDDNTVAEYPNRIRIPRGKRGSGLTFKVKDCFYDDDGEFLYRVPGMTN